MLLVVHLNSPTTLLISWLTSLQDSRDSIILLTVPGVAAFCSYIESVVLQIVSAFFMLQRVDEAQVKTLQFLTLILNIVSETGLFAVQNKYMTIDL